MADMDIVMIPSGGLEWLMFPQALVSRIYPYASPLGVESASEFVVGSLLVENEKMPVLDFVFTARELPYEGSYRLVLVATITNQSLFRTYALVSYGAPKILQLGDEQLQKRESAYHRFVVHCLAIDGEDGVPAVVLDLPKFESELKIK